MDATQATPSRRLPKSNFHHSIASAPAGPGVPATPLVSDAAPRDLDAVAETPVGSGFQHPDHQTPLPSYAGIEHLVIVCCHAIFHPDAESPSFPLNSPLVESNWHLAPFQRSDPKTGKPGEHETFLAHIAAGLSAITSGSWADNSLLVFSGGVTKGALTSLSEARSYYHASLAQGMSENHELPSLAKTLRDKGRILLEEHATDSFQNLLLSILLFRRTTGLYPKQIRVITHAFKAKRFLHLHAPAIQWPPSRIRVQGIDPVMSSSEHEATLRGEECFGYAPWKQDPLGTEGVVRQKRKQRGWEEETWQELGMGLEDSVRQLLLGKVQHLPWVEQLVASTEPTQDA